LAAVLTSPTRRISYVLDRVPRKRRRPSDAKAADRPVVAGAPGDGDVRRDRIAALALAGIVLVVFCSGLANGLVGDDFSLITNLRPDSILGVFDPWRDTWWYYRPITRLVLVLGYTLFGTAPVGYHVLSLLAHAAAVVLFYFGARRAGASAGPSFAGALVFAVHFRQHESVFWFSAISYPLSTAFGLGSALWFRASLARGHRGFLVAALVSAAAAMLTKDTATVVPALVALYGLLFAGEPFEGAPAREKVLRLLPLACVALVGIGLQAVPVEGRPFFARGGASFTARGAAASLEFVEVSALLLVPGLDAAPDATRSAAAWVAIAVFGGFAVVRRTRIALLGLAWVVVAHLPFYAFIPRMGDLYLYLPLAGVAFVAVDAAELLASGAARPALRTGAALGFAGLVLWSAARIQAKASRWHVAGEVVGGVVAEVKAARPFLARGATLVLEGLPDHVGGVYAFLNAAPGAFWLAYNDRTLNVVRPTAGETKDFPSAPRFLYEGGRFYEVDEMGRRRLLRTFSGAD
jgi:hypothetical protein